MLLSRLRLACDAMLLRSGQPLQRILFSHIVSGECHLLKSRQALYTVSKCFNHIRNHRKLLVPQATAEMSSTAGKPLYTNRLAKERSPYLLQHAHNPVDWYPWGPEAFERAVAENKPIFLSIGYSACHWCHVMERESFESIQIAEILKKSYIAIKLDREERPDIDQIYMTYVQKTTGSGGWPLTLFLTPTLEPLYGGTYFPPQDGNGRVGLKGLLDLVARQWQVEHVKLTKEAKNSLKLLQSQLTTSLSAKNKNVPGEICWKKCYDTMVKLFVPTYGGFSTSPKFPQTSLLNFLLHVYYQRPNEAEGKKALEMVLITLRKIGCGGIHDHVGSGFARYSVDGQWHVPHFEKMLYDQAQLAMTYTDAYVASKDPFFMDMAEDILKYVSRDLTHKQGAFYGAEDADSYPTADATEKKEGAFYVWTMDELKEILRDEKVLEVFCYHFGVKEEGNVDASLDPHHELRGQNVLCNFEPASVTAEKFNCSEDVVKTLVRTCLDLLLVERGKRPRPAADTKIVTAWNGLMIAAFAKAGFAFNNVTHIKRAVKAASFVKERLTSADGSLYRCCYGDRDSVKQNAQPIPGILEDYAFTIRGMIYLYEATLDGSWLEWAEQLQTLQNQKFWDGEHGSFFQSHGDDEFAIVRDKESQDGAEPCGNSVSAHNLIRLDHYLNREDFRSKASKIFKGFSSMLNEHPIALPEMTSALMLFYNQPYQIFIAGKRRAPDTEALLEVVRNQFLPGHVLVLADGPNGKSMLLYMRNQTLECLHPVGGRAAAYVCKEFACSMPVTTPEDLQKSLSGELQATRAQSADCSSESD
ncbi:spermatogenesis-associated protein 20 [Atheta coriaria]|uniref:spermatogenesis-associated protein 20 n=1 Tax=Dalotia coriaria TaxID=877792 RepID=UPI0031F42347